MKTVFVVQETTRNISPAREFGSIRVLTTWDDISKGSQYLVKFIREKFEAHQLSSQDYLLCIGDPTAIGLAVHVALTITGGKINLLIWDRETYSYNIERIELNGKTKSK
jgi:hypothetical protein